MKTGLDLDGICAEFEQHFLSYLDLPRHHATHWDDERFTKNFGLIASDYDFWLTIPPILDPKEMTFVPEVYVTARPVPSEVSAYWLELNGFPEAEVITVGMGGDKIVPLKGRVDVFLDDAIHNFEALNGAGVNCWLGTRPHNLGYQTDKRVEGIIDFQNRVLHEVIAK